MRDRPADTLDEGAMKKAWKIVGIATLVAILGAAAIGAVAFAQDARNGTSGPFNFQERFRRFPRRTRQDAARG
jgi:hypothetical protein